ncbi:MAG: hypothetical protein ACKPE6_08620, partial [Gammaproteobacteria bacterium]
PSRTRRCGEQPGLLPPSGARPYTRPRPATGQRRDPGVDIEMCPSRASEPSPGRDVLGNVARNLRRLLTGKAFSSLLMLAATLLTARTLSVEEFGLVVLLQSYVLVWSGLFNVKPFEAIIRYGVPALDRGDDAELLRLLKLGFLVDLATAVASAVLACTLAGSSGDSSAGTRASSVSRSSSAWCCSST